MRYVDYALNLQSPPQDWGDFLQHSFICHRCEKTFSSVSDELYFFPDEDALYHRHQDNTFYRAFTIQKDGEIQIGAFDSVEENVIQQYAFSLDGKGGTVPAGDVNSLKASSKKFFDSMKQQKRKIRPAELRIDF
ncbi:MAG: hypothetical protein P0119_07930 [Nitrospira sp.]|nr:hypothetical protein [Nitrospira sp.]